MTIMSDQMIMWTFFIFTAFTSRNKPRKMISNTSPSSMLVVLLCLLTMLPVVLCRNLRHFETMNEVQHFSGKFNPDCKGEYNPKLYSQLNKVCNDCFYIFYNEELADSCK